jgi:hypothetical protein
MKKGTKVKITMSYWPDVPYYAFVISFSDTGLTADFSSNEQGLLAQRDLPRGLFPFKAMIKLEVLDTKK